MVETTKTCIHGIRPKGNCRECKREDGREWRLKNKQLIKEHQYQYYLKNREKIREYHQQYRDIKKFKVLTHYGGSPPKCVCCGETILEFLTIDHMNDDGNKHRKMIGDSSLYLWLIKNNFPEGFQVLCWNCNCGKRVNGGICPHKSWK